MNTISAVLGGIGLFLLGMILMTDGLKTIAGDRLRRILSHFTGGTLSAILSGAAVTAVVQSSSATTLTTIGFVSAGLLTFRQATGIIFGSNLGTTSTSWIVSLIGLKLKISVIAMPLIGLGVLVKLFSRDKYSALGLVLAGFGLIFVGIDTLQAGMKELSALIDPASFPGDNLFNLVILILVGIVMTVVVQSSSAAVATTLAALSTNAIMLDQAAALVIGQNVGTTITAALAAIGGTVAAKRTALAHILFNVITGIAAVVMIPIFITLVAQAGDKIGLSDPAIALAFFHTSFNVLGIMLLTPFIDSFVRIISELLPEREVSLTKYLDPTVASVPSVAVEAARRTIVETSKFGLQTIKQLLQEGPSEKINQDLDTAMSVLKQIKSFVAHIPALAVETMEFKRYLSILHIIDHLARVLEVIQEYHDSEILRQQSSLQALSAKLFHDIDQSINWLSGDTRECNASLVEITSKAIAQTRRTRRAEILSDTAAGRINPEDGIQEINELIWLDRIGYHIWRIVYHLDECD